MTQGLILLGHGARNPAWAAPFVEVEAAIRRQAPQALISLAFLELLEPSLAEAGQRLVAQGATALTVLPLFLGGAGHVRRDVQPQAQALATEWGIPVEVLPALGEHAFFQQALTGWCLARLAPPEETP